MKFPAASVKFRGESTLAYGVDVSGAPVVSTTLVLGESLDLLRVLDTGSVDALITDPPYSSGGAMRGDRTFATSTKYVTSGSVRSWDEFTGDNRDQRSYAYWCALWFAECLRIVKPGGVAVVFTDWRQLPATTDALQSGGWVWRGVVPWAKLPGGYRPSAGRFAAQCEYAVWGSHGPLEIRKGVDRALPGFFHVSSSRDKSHIAEKPLAVMREICEIVPPGGLILDPFAGSASTLVAARQIGRSSIGFEQSPTIAAEAVKRLNADTLDLGGI